MEVNMLTPIINRIEVLIVNASQISGKVSMVQSIFALSLILSRFG